MYSYVINKEKNTMSITIDTHKCTHVYEQRYTYYLYLPIREIIIIGNLNIYIRNTDILYIRYTQIPLGGGPGLVPTFFIPLVSKPINKYKYS